MSASAPQVVSLPPASWWEHHFFPRLEAMIQDLLADVASGKPIVVPSTTGASGPTNLQGGLLPTLNLPISPKILAESAIAAHILGISTPLFPRYATAVPASGSALLTIPVPSSYVMLFVGPVRIFSDYYGSAELVGTLVVDSVNVLLNDFPFTAEASETSPQYGVVRNQIQATYLNGSSQDAVLTADAQTVLVKQQEYDGVWVPVFVHGYRIWQQYAAALKAAGLA